MNKLEDLKSKLEMVELEERLEMVQLISAEQELEGDNYCCTGSDATCKPSSSVN
ncbi:hypothetical protein [Chryseobacterium sp.]|uniref:hypothetical protein n=1 Tax=Chryseobacterium sp. TaxID=1871047 RepID=UPI0025BCC4C8|nr:hypothetical protein [Chryseobacterium sp.]MBV8324992.1 hypothetical protein [Chryseobacterium sp.]